MKHALAALLLLYPPASRDAFAEEMAAVLEASSGDRRSLGWAAYCIFLITEISGLLRGAAAAWAIALRQSRVIATIFPFLLGAMISGAILRPFIAVRSLPAVEPRLYTLQEISALIAMIAVSMVLLAGSSVAFVINLRTLARRRQAAGYRTRKAAF